MSSKLNMQDIVDLLVANNEISKEDADLFVAQFFSLIEKGLSDDDLVKIKDFGSFKLTHIRERESVNVNTQEKIVIPAHRRVSFLPAPSLKELVNKPFAHFETTPLNDGIFMDGISQETTPDNENEELDAEDEDDMTGNEAVEKEEPIEEAESLKTDIEEPSIENDLDEMQSDESLPPVDASLSRDEIEESTSPIEDDSISATSQEDSLSLDEEKQKQTVEEQVVEEQETKEESKLPAQKAIIATSKKSSSKKPKTKGKLRRYILRWDIGVALFMIFAIGFAYNFYFSKHNPCEKGIEESEIPKPIKQEDPAPAKAPSVAPAISADSVETKKTPVEPPQVVKMSPGRTLRLIALEKFGNREFWVYIYMKNKDKIENPDVIPIGLELELPTAGEYPMDSNNPDEVAKAKTLGDNLMKEFW